MNSNIQDRLAEVIKHSKIDTPVQSDPPVMPGESINSGALYVFKMPISVPIQWCPIFMHPDDEQVWFVVPGDEFSLVGTKDVEVPQDAECGPLNLRCANGIWLHTEDFLGGIRFGQLDLDFVDQVRERLARMINDDLPDVQFLRDNDLDPDYCEWMEELAEAVAAFENKIAGITTQQVYVFSSDWAAKIPGAESMPMALAADASDLTKMPDVEKPTVSRTGTCVDYDGPGNLVALKYERCVVFQIYNLPEGVDPPTIVANEVSLEWDPFRSYLATDDVDWSQGQIEFSINGEQWPPIER